MLSLMNKFYGNWQFGFMILLCLPIVLLIAVLYERRNVRLVLQHELNNLHQAILENDVIQSIRLIEKEPSAINVIHSADGYSAFMRACLNGNTQLVNIMLKYGGDINLKSLNGETPFYLAVFYYAQNPNISDATCIHALYCAGADINATNSKGYTAIHLATSFGHTSLVQWLINKGAFSTMQPNPYITNKHGHTSTAALLRGPELLTIE